MQNNRCSIMKLVRSLNDRDANGGFWLPNIQRPFVWKEEQIERLFDSIMREYPISTLLVWRTKEQVKHRKFIDNYKAAAHLSDYFVPDHEGAKNLVLDGQQRTQSLYIGLRGSYEGKELYLDMLSGEPKAPEDVRYRYRFLADAAWPWVKLKDVVNQLDRQNRLPTQVAADLEAKAGTALSEAQRNRLLENVMLVWREFVHDDNISYQELDGVDSTAYRIDDVVEIFIRANSGGTKLGKSDLMFSLVAQSWSEADESLEELLDKLNQSGYGFERDFVLKSALVMLGHGAKYDVAKFRDPAIRDEFVEKWQELSNAIRGVKDFLQGKTFLRTDKAVPSYLGLIPLIYFRYRFPDRWATSAGREQYVLLTMLTGAFSGTPDNLIDRCVKAIQERGDFDVDEMFQIIRDDGRSLEVNAGTILGTRYGKPLSHLIFNLWYRDFEYEPALEDNLPQQDHIFPQSALKEQKHINPATGRWGRMYDKNTRDQIANLALLTAKDNGFSGKSGQLPEKWLPEQIAKDPGFLERHLIPKDPDLWKLDNYPKFIEARRKLILEKFKPYLQASQSVGEEDVAEAMA
ncbi:hypothetical protein ABW45_08225 [Stenotrophomonas maltophilia]|nr:hypothetical protein ABW45_08225 [Stenotrophomonas maltophilia]